MLDFIIVICYTLQYSWASLVAQLVKNLPAMRETWIESLGWKDPLEKGKATHSSILAWRIPWIQSMGSPRVGHDWATYTFTSVPNQTMHLCPESAISHMLLEIFQDTDTLTTTPRRHSTSEPQQIHQQASIQRGRHSHACSNSTPQLVHR